MSELALLFAGAGASKAVDPTQYPTTVEFFDRLPERITHRKLYNLLIDYVRPRLQGNQLDIEQLLWTLDELRQFTDSVVNSETVPGWFVEGNRIAAITGTQNNIGAF